jgi:phytoene dehydrogenase-like protein
VSRGEKTWDAVIVGGGHNGLVAGFYLARAGLRTLICERREIVGGCCVTEEFAPGFRASTGAYVLSMLRAPIWRDLRLLERGVAVDPAGPSLNLYADGAALHLDDDLARTQQEVRPFSAADARALPAFEAELARLAELITPLIDTTPPDPRARRPRDLVRLAGLGLRAARHRALLADAAYLFGTSATQFLTERFESEHLLAALGWHAINDSTAGPSTPGTAYVLLHDHASEQAGGGIRQWGFVRGGIGRVSEAMADAAREAGAEIRTSAAVERIVVENGRVAGVELAAGEVIRARRVLSNADPKTTFLRLLEDAALPAEFVGAVRAYRCEGTSVKINLAVGELPRAAAVPGDGVQPYHRGIVEINPTLAEMDAAQAEARAGRPAADPHIELCVPTVHDPAWRPTARTWSRSTSTPSPTRSPRAPGRSGEIAWPTPRSPGSASTSPTFRRRSSTARSSPPPTSSRCSASGAGTPCTATWRSTSSSTCARCAAGATTARLSATSICAAPGPIPAAGSPGRTGATAPAR